MGGVAPPPNYSNDNSAIISYIVIAFFITLILALILARIIAARLKVKRYNQFNEGGNKETTETNHPRKTHSFLILLITEIIAIALFALGVHLFAKRDATNNDLKINHHADFSTIGVQCNIVPNENIDDLDLKFSFYNINDKKMYELTKSIGKVKKGSTYSVAISLYELTEYGLPYSCTIDVASGKIQILF